MKRLRQAVRGAGLGRRAIGRNSLPDRRHHHRSRLAAVSHPGCASTPVYFGHFKCNRQRIADYKNISHYLKALYEVARRQGNGRSRHIKTHYYWKPHHHQPDERIVPKGRSWSF